MENVTVVCIEDTVVEFDEGGEFVAREGDICTLEAEDHCGGRILYNDERDDDSSSIFINFNDPMEDDEEWFNKHFMIID